MSFVPVNQFTPRAQQVLALARKQADRLSHDHIGPHHLLLGILRLDQGVACSVLKTVSVDFESLKKVVEDKFPPGKESGEGTSRNSIPYTPHLKKILGLAVREAKRLNHSYVGSEHLLLGLLADEDHEMGKILRDHFKLDVEAIRTAVLNELDPTVRILSKPDRVKACFFILKKLIEIVSICKEKMEYGGNDLFESVINLVFREFEEHHMGSGATKEEYLQALDQIVVESESLRSLESAVRLYRILEVDLVSHFLIRIAKLESGEAGKEAFLAVAQIGNSEPFTSTDDYVVEWMKLKKLI